ncbi:hypothetical protein ACLBOM_30135 [Escherichia coli]
MLFGFLLAIANKLLMRRPTWLIVRQKLLLRIPIMGSLMRGQKLTQIFTILALTQSAGITFAGRRERQNNALPVLGATLTQINTISVTVIPSGWRYKIPGSLARSVCN